jgi:hypothetical protein
MLQCSCSRMANADFDKALAKESGTEDGVVVAAPSRGARISTSAQVLAEHRQINVARDCPLPSDDMASVRCSPRISHRRAGAITLSLERSRETVKVWSRLGRSADAPGASMPRSRSPTYSFPFETGHQWPSRRSQGIALLRIQKAPAIHRIMLMLVSQLPITGPAHKAAVVGDTLVAAVRERSPPFARCVGRANPNPSVESNRSTCAYRPPAKHRRRHDSFLYLRSHPPASR